MVWSGKDLCPPALVGAPVVLRSKDKETFEMIGEAACISDVLRAQLLAAEPTKGSDPHTIDVPLKKIALGKAVEFMKYHATVPYAEIRTPFESDNLVECGASKWDAALMSVDKDTLFETMVAATMLSIPSLFFLCAAKAALLTKGKDETKLRKEFTLTNDMDQDELDDVKTKYRNARWFNTREEPPEDSANLLAVGVVLSALQTAAERNDVLETDGGVSLKSYRHASWHAAVIEDTNLLAEAPTEVRQDRDFNLRGVRCKSRHSLEVCVWGAAG